MKFFALFLISIFLSFHQLSGQSYEIDVLCDERACPFIPLVNLEDGELNQKLTKKLNSNPKWKRLIDQKRMSVGLVDLREATDIDFACVNCDEMMYAASLPKIAILLAAMESFEDGSLPETPEILNDLKLMISVSDNHASTRMIDRLTFQKIEDVLTCQKYQLYDASAGGGLWVGKRYGSGGSRNPDPVKGLSHAATVTQVCRFYYLMARGQLVNEARSKQMMDIMVDPALHHKFVNTFDIIAPFSKIYRKSGSWKTFHSDSALIWGANGRQYILTALVNDSNGESIMRQLVREVDDLLKKNGAKA